MAVALESDSLRFDQGTIYELDFLRHLYRIRRLLSKLQRPDELTPSKRFAVGWR